MIAWIRRRRSERRLVDVLRQLDEMSPSDAASVLRELIGTNQDREVHGELLARIAEKAAEGAPEAGRSVLRRYAETYRQGRLVMWGTATAVLMHEGESPELIAAIEAAFESKEISDG
jgi:hypothetical protein